MRLDEIQRRVYQNKVNKGFNITNIEKEFCLLYGEVGETFEAWRKKQNDLGGEIADVAIYLLGLSEMLGFSLQDEIERKMLTNEAREYALDDDGVLKKK